MGFLGLGKAADGGATGQITERELKLDYFGHVFADYCRLPQHSRAELLNDLPQSFNTLLTELERTGEITEAQEGFVDWSEIATIEDKILSRLDEATLRRRAWQLRSRYARLTGPERYQQYLASRPPDETDPDVPVEKLRADLRGVLGLTHFNYSLAVVRENLRRRVLMGTLWLTALFCAAAALLAIATDVARLGTPDFLARRPPLALTVLVVTLFGWLGAFLSTQRRLQQPTDGGDPLIAILGLYEFNNIKRFPLIAGGLFAVVLYLVMVAGFMKGDLFPVLVAGIPWDSVAWAKLLIWALLAGFAERLVPDTLDRLVNQAQPKVPVSPPSGAGTPDESNKSRGGTKPPPPTGGASGTVSKPDGSPASGARVTVVQPGTEAKLATATAEGVYTFDGLAPGEYTLQASLASFGNSDPAVVRITAGATQTAELRLKSA